MIASTTFTSKAFSCLPPFNDLHSVSTVPIHQLIRCLSSPKITARTAVRVITLCRSPTERPPRRTGFQPSRLAKAEQQPTPREVTAFTRGYLAKFTTSDCKSPRTMSPGGKKSNRSRIGNYCKIQLRRSWVTQILSFRLLDRSGEGHTPYRGEKDPSCLQNSAQQNPRLHRPCVALTHCGRELAVLHSKRHRGQGQEGQQEGTGFGDHW